MTLGFTTHVLDLSRGLPAPGIAVRLEMQVNRDWIEVSQRTTDADGRARLIEAETALENGDYRLSFEVETYFEGQNVPAFYPRVQVIFRVNETRHYHVPLLLSPFGFSTYRGS